MGIEDDKILEQLKKDFVDEVSSYLEQCEESYLKLENPECRAEEISKIFRYAHSIKGSGAALGYLDFSNFAHQIEDCLAILRDRPNLIQPEIISLLLRTTDALKVKIEMIRQNENKPWVVDDLKSELVTLIHKMDGKSPEAAKPIPASQPTAEIETDFDFAADPRFASNTTMEEIIKAKAKTLDSWQTLATETHKHLSVGAQVNPPSSPPVPPNLSPVTASIKNSAPPVAPPVSASPSSPPSSSSSSPPPNRDPAANSPRPDPNNGSSSVKIETDRIDRILNVVGELVVIKSQLMNQASHYLGDLKLHAVVSLMDKTIRDLQDKTLTMRMMPLKSLFLKLQRTVRELSIKLNKSVEFKVSGEETEIDRNMVELLGDPLLHICRNALDHGIEHLDIRKAQGKSEKGTIHLSARQTGGRVVIEVRDDGGGLNTERIVEKAKKVGLLHQSQTLGSLTEKEIHNILFQPGFSTVDAITDVSGRGVGMDVVRSNIEKLRGSIDILSEKSNGTTMTISLPLTTSITDGMLVEVGQSPFIIPMNTIHELVNAGQTASIQLHLGQKVLNYRGKFLPIFDLRELLDRQLAPHQQSNGSGPKKTITAQADDVVVIVETGTRFVALRLERIIGQVQVVLKSLGSSFNTSKGITGATILGDGKVALVLDPIGLSEYAIEFEARQRMTKREAGKAL